MARQIQYTLSITPDQALQRISTLITSTHTSWWSLYLDRLDPQQRRADPDGVAGTIAGDQFRLYKRFSRGFEFTPPTAHGVVTQIGGTTVVDVMLRYTVARLVFVGIWVAWFAMIIVSPLVYYPLSLLLPDPLTFAAVVLAITADILVVILILKLDRAHTTVGERSLREQIEAVLDGAIQPRQSRP
jgi:hypothetical protein